MRSETAVRRRPTATAAVEGDNNRVLRRSEPANNPSGPSRTHRHGREVTRPIYRLQLSPAAAPTCCRPGWTEDPLDRVRVRGLPPPSRRVARFPNPPTELQAMSGRFHRPEPWSHALGRLLLVGFAPLDLGCQGQRATSEVATRDNLARPGRPHGQGLGTADEVRAHWDGVGTDRSDRGCLCWHTVNSKLSLGECGWGGIASTHAWPPSYMAGSHPARLAADHPCSSRLVVQADWPNHHNSRGSLSRTRHITTGEHPLVDAFVAGHHPLG
jgi:hypothetical protein